MHIRIDSSGFIGRNYIRQGTRGRIMWRDKDKRDRESKREAKLAALQRRERVKC